MIEALVINLSYIIINFNCWIKNGRIIPIQKQSL